MKNRIDMMMTTTMTMMIVLLQTSSARSASTVERSDHKCGQNPDKSYAYCDQGRCCSNSFYCGDDVFHCDYPHCWYQCREFPPAAANHSQSNYEAAESGGGVLLAHLANATRSNYNNHYLNGDDDDDDVVKVAAANASSPAASPLSCATSLSRLTLASRHKYPFAGLRAPRSQNKFATVTHCGRCLKVTSFGVRGLPNQVKVRIAHELNNAEGLELDFNTFRELDTDGSGAEGRILVKYQFDNC